MCFIYYKINLVLTWSGVCDIPSTTWATKFAIADTKPYIPIVTLSIKDNAKLLKESKSGFKITINWNKYQLKASTEGQNEYLD